MSFSSRVKGEVARIHGERDCCRQAELAALGQLAAVRQPGENETVSWAFFAENAATARKVFTLLRRHSSLPVQLGVQAGGRGRRRGSYCVRVCGNPETSPRTSWGESWKSSGPGAPVRDRCCQRSFLRGSFLAAGSISHPERGNHLELTLPPGKIEDSVRQVMENLEIHPHRTWRKGRAVLYLKEGEQIVRFLSAIGAHGSLLEYENIRVRREVRNSINRILNCETANVEKTVEAGMRQSLKIQKIIEKEKLDQLPARLKEIAALRLDHPEMSLAELGQHMEPPLTKSGVNHLLRRLEEKADTITGEGCD